MRDLLVGLGLLLAFEGTLYAGFPGAAKKLMKQMTDAPEPMLRGAGLTALLGGFLLVWLVRG